MADPLKTLTTCLARLPGIGERSAQRIALHLVDGKKAHARDLADAITAAVANSVRCETCGDIALVPTCSICASPKRDASTIYVVARSQDRIALERASVITGRYHILGGLLDPLNGVGPNQLNLRTLLERLRDPEVTEVVVATSPTVEGDATATYIARLLDSAGLDVTVTRPASGVAVGSDLEYADASALARAISDRRKIV